MKLPIISLAILGGQAALANAAGTDILHKLAAFSTFYTGFDPTNGQFLPQNLVVGYGPWLAKRFLLPIINPGRSLARMHLPISLS
jgi:hypothetical protein